MWIRSGGSGKGGLLDSRQQPAVTQLVLLASLLKESEL